MNDEVIGEITPVEDAPPPDRPPETAPRRGRRRPIGYTCLLGVLGALVGALLAVLWALGMLGGREPVDEVQPPHPAETEEVDGEWIERIAFSPDPERPEATPEIISAETPVIYCFYEHSRIPLDAALGARWSYEGEDLGELELRDHQRGIQSLDAEESEPPGHAVGRFSVHPPQAEGEAPAGFPAGVYEVELSCVGREDLSWSGSFMALPRAAKILEGGGPPDAPLLITDLQVAPEVAEDGKPLEPSTELPGSIRRIYACFQYKGMAPGGSLTVRWHVDNRELPRAREELAISTSQGWGNAWLERSGPEPFPRGSYQVTVHLGADERPLASLGFAVTEAEPPQPQPDTE